MPVQNAALAFARISTHMIVPVHVHMQLTSLRSHGAEPGEDVQDKGRKRLAEPDGAGTASAAASAKPMSAAAKAKAEKEV